MVSWPHYLPVTGSCISFESCLHANSYILWYHDIRIRMCYFITRNHRKIAFRPEGVSVFSAVFCRFWKNLLIFFNFHRIFVSTHIFYSFRYRTYGKRDPEGVMANWIGILIIVFGVLVVYLATNYKYKRLPRPEDEMLLNETHTNLE